MKIENIIKNLFLNQEHYSLDGIEKIPEFEIIKYEKKNNYCLPGDYKYFLENYNGLIIAGIELIFFENSIEISINNIQKLELENGNILQDYLIPFAYNGRGDYYCINKNDNKIYFWQHDCDDPNFNPDYDCESFSDWLEENIKNSLEALNS